MFARETKPLASLSSGLLARKGGARPAMRPQAFGTLSAPVEDLGWNDMGGEPAAPAPVVVAVPPVLAQREALQEEIGAARATRPVSVATATRMARETAKQTKNGGKAAFTLRLDAERHLRLRLASAVSNESAQTLVTRAVDALLNALPEVELLVAQLPPAKTVSR